MANIKLQSWLCSLVIIQCYVNAYSVEPVAILPVEVRSRYSPRYLPNVNPPPMERLDALSLPDPQQALLHRNEDPPPRAEIRESFEYLRDADADERAAEENSTNLVNDFLRAIGVDDPDNQEARDNSRSYLRDYQYSPYLQQQSYLPQQQVYRPQQQLYQAQQQLYQAQHQPHPQQPQLYPLKQQQYPQIHPVQQSYSGQSRPNYSPVPPSIDYGSGYLQPAHVPSYKTLDLIKPFASKVSTKVGGLVSIVLALLGGGGASGLSGFKDILVNGIIKPLFSLKGGLKELISKLSIPILGLLLINVEVLLTIWWLWDDCPQVQAAHAAVYPAPAATSYQYPKQQPVFSYNSNY